MSTERSSKSKSTLIGCGALCLWASSLPLAKRCIEDLGPFTTITIQFFVSGILGLLYFTLSGKFRSLQFFRNWQFYARILLFAVYMGLLYFAISHVERANLPIVTLLNYLWPTFTMVFSVVLLRQRTRVRYLILGSLVVVIGLSVEILGEQFQTLLRSPKDGMTLLAFLSAFTGAIVWGLNSVLTRKWGTLSGELPALPFILLCASFILAIARIYFGETSTFNSEITLPLAYLSCMSICAYICWDIGTRLGNITVLSLLADGLPWVSLTITQLYLGVAIGRLTWIAAIVIVLGALISRYSILSAQPKISGELESLPTS